MKERGEVGQLLQERKRIKGGGKLLGKTYWGGGVVGVWLGGWGCLSTGKKKHR